MADRDVATRPPVPDQGQRWSDLRKRLANDFPNPYAYETPSWETFNAHLDAWASYMAQIETRRAELLDSLLAVEWAGSSEGEYFPDLVDCCPNCGAEVSPEIEDGQGAALHYTGCELRDSLDAALGVTSPRVERAHG